MGIFAYFPKKNVRQPGKRLAESFLWVQNPAAFFFAEEIIVLGGFVESHPLCLHTVCLLSWQYLPVRIAETESIDGGDGCLDVRQELVIAMRTGQSRRLKIHAGL